MSEPITAHIKKNIANDNFNDLVQKVITNNGIEDVSEIRFSNSGFYSVLGTTTLTNDRTITLPNLSGMIALTSGSQTFTDKTLTAPIISTISNTGTLTLPTTTGTVALTSDIPTNTTYVDLISNQTIGGLKSFSNYVQITNQYGLNGSNISGCTLYSNSFTNGLGGFQFNTTDQSTGFGILKLPSMASSATYTFPDITGTILSTNAQQTIQNKDISFLSPVPLLAVVSATTLSCTRTHGLDIGDTISFPNLGAITGIVANTTYTIGSLPSTSEFTLLGIVGLGGSVSVGSYFIIISHVLANPGIFQMIDSQNTGFPLQFDLSTCLKAPLLRFLNNSTASAISFPAAGGNLMNTTSPFTISGIHTHSAQMIMTRLGQTTAVLAPFYYNHSNTPFTAANNYYFVHHGIPPSTGNTTGFASTVHIQGAPANATTPSALRIESGDFLQLGTGKTQCPKLKVSTVGSEIAGIVRGSNSITAPGAMGPNGSTVTITHNLGIAPVFISAIVDKNGFGIVSDNFAVAVRSHSTTQVVFEVWRVDSNSGWASTYQLDWMVMG